MKAFLFVFFLFYCAMNLSGSTVKHVPTLEPTEAILREEEKLSE